MEDQQKRQSLALCMIVRDEADMLPECLERAKGVWDELIVVDTGSTDGTVAIAEAAGAKVIAHGWNDDFAEARNVALDAVQSDWVLMLDADELLSEELNAEIRALLSDTKVGAAMINIRNLLPHGLVRMGPVVRLFRSHPEVRYRFAIHEDISSSLQPYLARTGRKVAMLPSALEHRGYVRERAAGKGKKERDLRILNRCLEQDRGDIYSHFKRLELARYWDDTELWKTAATDAKAALEAAGDGALHGQHFGGELLVLIAYGMYARDEALRFLDSHREQVPPSATLEYTRGQLLEEAGQAAQADEAFKRCLEIEEIRDPQMASVRPLMGLCRLGMAKGDSQQACEYADRALAHAPRDPETLLAAFTLRMMRAPDEAQRFAEGHIEAHGESPELLQAWSQAAMAYGQPAAAELALRKLAGDPPSGKPALHLAQAMVRLGKLEEARALLLTLVESMPEAGIGVLVCELCLDQDTNLELELDEGIADRLLREWIVTALLGADDEVLRNVAKRVPTIEHVFPWLPEALGLAA